MRDWSKWKEDKVTPEKIDAVLSQLGLSRTEPIGDLLIPGIRGALGFGESVADISARYKPDVQRLMAK
jgi:hypothetical protein